VPSEQASEGPEGDVGAEDGRWSWSAKLRLYQDECSSDCEPGDAKVQGKA
jgi:hypothetical protein